MLFCLQSKDFFNYSLCELNQPQSKHIMVVIYMAVYKCMQVGIYPTCKYILIANGISVCNRPHRYARPGPGQGTGTALLNYTFRDH